MNRTLQEMLEDANVKQKELARLLCLDESTISLKISGKRKMSLDEAAIIAERLKTTSDQIHCALNFAKRKVELQNARAS